MEQGIPSPCSGVLVPTDEAKQCLTTARVLLPACEADLQLVAGTLSAARDAFSVQLGAKEEQVATLERLLSDAYVPAPWYEDPVLAFTVGVLTASAVAVTLAISR
tara:strand:+ start:240 stop:554 length:315 start_codon:yes stop_codon:yes gene_type:complete